MKIFSVDASSVFFFYYFICTKIFVMLHVINSYKNDCE